MDGNVNLKNQDGLNSSDAERGTAAGVLELDADRLSLIGRRALRTGGDPGPAGGEGGGQME